MKDIQRGIVGGNVPQPPSQQTGMQFNQLIVE
jgi:hypothetical protein